MLRITELSLPVGHPPDALGRAIQTRLKLPEGALIEFAVFRRSYDARKKNAELCFVYTVDCQVRDEARVLDRFKTDRKIGPTPPPRRLKVSTIVRW